MRKRTATQKRIVRLLLLLLAIRVVVVVKCEAPKRIMKNDCCGASDRAKKKPEFALVLVGPP